jgi:REP element-mobilizing transposase RayT
MRINIPNATYFISKSTFNKKPLFINDNIAQVVVSSLKYMSLHKNTIIHTYVIMPTHYHLLISLGEDLNISSFLHMLNSYSAHQISKITKEKIIWDNRTWDEVIRNEEMYYQKLAYILLNPWRKKLVNDPYDSYNILT